MNAEMNKHVGSRDWRYKDRDKKKFENPGEVAFCTKSHNTLCKIIQSDIKKLQG